jgi:hypothetical protein
VERERLLLQLVLNKAPQASIRRCPSLASVESITRRCVWSRHLCWVVYLGVELGDLDGVFERLAEVFCGGHGGVTGLNVQF